MGQRMSVKIAGKEFELSAETPEKEEIIRKAAVMLNAHYSSYAQKFANKSMTDILSLVGLYECMKIIALEKSMARVEKEADTLTEDLEAYLKKNIG